MEVRGEVTVLGYVALTISPIVGWASMAVTWAIVDTELSGGLDVGVPLLGAVVSAGLTLVCCYGAQVDKRRGTQLVALSFGLTFGIALIAVVGFNLWLDSLFSGVGGAD